MPIKEVNQNMYENAISLYFDWKSLNQGTKDLSRRGVNFPEAVTETITCYVNGYYLSEGGGSEDAVVPETGETIQIKASSNFNSDLTSFGPASKFDYLHFVRLDQVTDEMYLYDIPITDLKEVKVNATQTFRDQQLQGRRPRFSIINQYIKRYDIQPYAIVELKTGIINKTLQV
ncbi:Bsp6I family type II restriction endonuclease [Bacillus sp. T_4]|nr:Bsp6I family type II restriction endonuclease [Bacillus sp. T_4]